LGKGGLPGQGLLTQRIMQVGARFFF
jgi:hypothetical protein